MIVKAMWPFPPVLPETNLTNVLTRRPDQAEWADFTMAVDAVTGKATKFSEFNEKVALAATALGSDKGLGLKPDQGEMIGVLSENCTDYVVLNHALWSITVPFALLSSYSTEFELKHTVTLSKCTRLFVAPNRLALALKVGKTCGIPPSKIYILNGHAKGHQDLDGMIAKVKKNKVPLEPVRPAKKDTLAYLVFSSGTSGLPKAVMISHGNLIFSFMQAVTMAKVTSEVVPTPEYPTAEGIPTMLCFLPMHHSYGFHVTHLRNFIIRCTMIIMPKWDARRALKLVEKHKMTHLLLIPSVVHQLVNLPEFERTDLSTVFSVGSGAAHLPTSLAAKLCGFTKNAIVTDGYGQSEGTLSAIQRPHPEIFGRLNCPPSSTGILTPGIEARVVRSDGTDADYNEEGDLWIRGGGVALGYVGNPKANEETFVDGWLNTGDRFKFDEKGFFYFADRAKDTLKISGAQVSPSEIEAVMLAQPDKLITDVTVAGVSGGRTSDEKVPRAWIVLSREGKERSKAEVIATMEKWTQDNLSKYKWLRGGIEMVKEIPKNPTGKVLRRVLQDKYEESLKKKGKAKL